MEWTWLALKISWNNSRSQCSLLELINNFRMADLTSSWHPIGSKVRKIISPVLSHGLTDLMWLEEGKKNNNTHYAFKTQMQLTSWALWALNIIWRRQLNVFASHQWGEKKKQEKNFDWRTFLHPVLRSKQKDQRSDTTQSKKNGRKHT